MQENSFDKVRQGSGACDRIPGISGGFDRVGRSGVEGFLQKEPALCRLFGGKNKLSARAVCQSAQFGAVEQSKSEPVF